MVTEVKRTRCSMLSAPWSKGRPKHSDSPSTRTVLGSGSIDSERIRILLSLSTQLPGSNKRLEKIFRHEGKDSGKDVQDQQVLL